MVELRDKFKKNVYAIPYHYALDCEDKCGFGPNYITASII